MRRLLLLIPLLTLCSIAALAQQSSDFMPYDEVKPGMTGTVVTTLKGNQQEEFTAEVEGLLPNTLGPKFNLIIIRFHGERMKEIGVASGMSGSPFYIDGRLVGAVSYRLGEFPKDPIAGVTPIQAMLDTQYGSRGAPQMAFNYESLFRNSEAGAMVASAIGKSYSEATNEKRPEDSLVQPILNSFSYSGLLPETITDYAQLFSSTPVAMAVAGSGEQAATKPVPGSHIYAGIITGDLSFGATGTVTHVDGNRLWAFGHPLNQLGSINYFLHSAEVITVLTSLSGSGLMAVAGPEIGTIIEDRQAAIYGQLGLKANRIPLTVRVSYQGTEVESYTYNMVDMPSFIPGMLSLAISNSIYATQPVIGEMSCELSANFAIKGHNDLSFANFFTGNSVPAEAGIFTGSLAYFILNNEFEKIDFNDVTIEVNMIDGLRSATLQRAWVSRSKIKQGENFTLKMEYKPLRKRAMIHTEEYFIPDTLQPGKYKIIIGNGNSIIQYEQQIVEGTVQNTSFEQLLNLINRLRQNNRLYAQIMRSEEGLIYNGYFFPSLPASKQSVVARNATNSDLAKLNGLVLDERHVETEYLIRGFKILEIEVIE